VNTVGKARVTLDDLYRVECKAELIGGRVVEYMPTGVRPNEVAGNLYVSLRSHARASGRGRAFTDSIGYAVPVLPSGRESFSPVASYYEGPLPANLMRFVPGPPTFAAEVRSENGYTPSALPEQEAKRADYFQAGTRVVWDVDPVNEVVYVYKSDAPTQPVAYRRGQVAEAEPAVPGWRMPVDEVFA
jgi:Uma2 family endonuclease